MLDTSRTLTLQWDNDLVQIDLVRLLDSANFRHREMQPAVTHVLNQLYCALP
jgi:hypothetical protein